jgi:uncharacterized delta-60 repeat protein
MRVKPLRIVRRTGRPAAIVAAAAALLVAVSVPASAAPGDLDTSFGAVGRVRTDFTGHFDTAEDVLVQPDGRVVVVGETLTGAAFDHADFGVARYTGGGHPDTGFSGDGRTRTDFGGFGDVANAVARQADGKLVVAGSASLASGRNRFAAARYTAGGALDPSFSGDGKVATAFDGYQDASARDVAVQADGRIVVAGGATSFPPAASRGVPGAQSDFALARYLPGGGLDTSFGAGGKVTTDFAGSWDSASTVLVLPSGKILVAGYSQTAGGDERVAVVRYRSNGVRDTTFSGDGRVAVNMVPGQSEGAVGIALRSDGTYVVGAYVVDGVSASSGYDLGVLLLNGDGSIHSGFGGGDGIVFDDFGDIQIVDQMLMQADGKLVFVASRPPGGGFPQAIWVFRLQKSGAPDTGFGTGGRAEVADPAGVGGFGETLDASGRIVAVGRVGVGSDADFAAVRLLG